MDAKKVAEYLQNSLIGWTGPPPVIGYDNASKITHPAHDLA
jgi:hypothetical protein